jgi:hypothetical protein
MRRPVALSSTIHTRNPSSPEESTCREDNKSVSARFSGSFDKGSLIVNVAPRPSPGLQLGDMADNRQAQTEPTVLSSRRALRLAKSVEHVGQEFRSNPLAGVADRDHGVRTHPFQLYINLASRRR